MANDEERAALEGHVAALEAQIQSARSDKGRATRNYVIRTQVFDECIGLPPPTEPEESAGSGGASVNVRLDRIEAQLQRILAKLEA
jgi:hypothetical protein